MESEEIRKIAAFRRELLLIHVRLETLGREVDKEIKGACSTIMMLRSELLSVLKNNEYQGD